MPPRDPPLRLVQLGHVALVISRTHVPTSYELVLLGQLLARMQLTAPANDAPHSAADPHRLPG